MTKISGVYVIICIKNGNYYIGSSNDILERKTRHLSDLIKNKHHCSRLQRCYNKHGKDSLIFLIVEIDVREDFLKPTEQIYLNEAKSNKTECLNSSFISSGVEMTDEIKQKLSIKCKERYKIKSNHPRFGKKNGDLSKEKQRNCWKIKYQNGYKNPNTGKTMSKELKEKLLMINIGKKINIQTKQKMSDSHKGIKSYSFDHKIYTFKNLDTNEIYIGYKYDFRNKFNLKKSSVGQLTSNKLKSHKKWIIIN